MVHQHPQRERLLADDELQLLQVLVLCHRQLVQKLTAVRRRLRSAHVAARPSIQRVIHFLKDELADSEAQVVMTVVAESGKCDVPFPPSWPQPVRPLLMLAGNAPA